MCSSLFRFCLLQCRVPSDSPATPHTPIPIHGRGQAKKLPYTLLWYSHSKSCYRSVSWVPFLCTRLPVSMASFGITMASQSGCHVALAYSQIQISPYDIPRNVTFNIRHDPKIGVGVLMETSSQIQSLIGRYNALLSIFIIIPLSRDTLLDAESAA